ncbi:MAG: rhodanese-related sulfurtransferase [Chlorobia bacterium]|nr:rhodanese-related sulfurtransferase [Fimbriimonadaceae bacterium]
MSLDFQILLYYCFVDIPDPEDIAAEQRAWCEELGLRGRVIVAAEGINGTVSGSHEAADAYMEKMREHALFAPTEFKIDDHDRHAFKRLSVKVRSEIVTLGLLVDTVAHTGKHLAPAEFKAKMADPDALILDIRNDYEFAMGRFKGAVRPPVESFREFPGWIRDNFTDAKHKPILTYCTGGIRCEKLTAFLKEEGFEDVYQLHGGIVAYAKDPGVQGEGFEGDCFMFDDRMSVPVGPPVSHCEKCGRLSARYVNCSNVDCNKLYFLCETCEAAKGLSCSDACHNVVRSREQNARLSPDLRSEAARLRKQRHRAKRRLALQSTHVRNTIGP